MLGRTWALLRRWGWTGAWAACAAWVLVACGGGAAEGEAPVAAGPTVVAMNFIATSPARLEVTFSEPMNPTYFTTGGYVPTSSVWETTTKFVITFTSVSPGGFITLKAPSAGDPRGFKSAAGRAMPADVNFQFPTSAGAGGAPSIVGLNFVAAAPARLEVTFSAPMDPAYFTTGAYVPTSSVWETTTRFVVTFSSVTPGGTLVLKAPTASDPRGFKSAAGAGMPADVSFRFPTETAAGGGGGSAPVVTGLNFIAAAPARLEVTFSEPMNPAYFTTGAYVPTSSVWESTTKFVITFASVTPGGTLVLKAPTSGAPGGFQSAAGAAMGADVPFQFPTDPPPGSGAPAVTGLNFVATAPARLEVSFGEPMTPGYFTTGAYVPTSSVWETTSKFVITFSSVTPGGVITLKAPAVGDGTGFRSAAGVPLSADLPFQFPPAR